MQKIFCVISHTHWDREWYMSLEKFRIRLVDLIDNVLDILKDNQEYIFHLDAQCIVLEDYFDVKPYNKELVHGYVKEGRLLIGPWYVQNDFYLTSGEATVRNLLIGSKISNEAGKCSWVGYTPDQFGLISQLPQIFNGFGIDNCIFGRGYTLFEKENNELKHKIMPSEFKWVSEDGSEVLAVNMPFWYNNAQRFSEDINKSMKLLDLIERSFEGVALTPYLLLMNGVDHLEAQENLLPILESLKQKLPEGKQISQYTMQKYVDDVKKYFVTEPGSNLDSYAGELRNGTDLHILQGTLSSRVYLKVANTNAQNLLENKLEPLYSFILLSGAEKEYQYDFLNYLWKVLIQNHPHDSICGCSMDEVHNHMEDRFERIEESGEMLLKRGMDFITSHVDRSGFNKEDYLISVFNTVETNRSGVIALDVEFPVTEVVSSFEILDESNNSVPFVLISKERRHRQLFSPINLPGSLEVDSFKVKVFIQDMEGLSYRVLTVKPSKAPAVIDQSNAEVKFENTMENDSIKVIIAQDGTVDLFNKGTGRLYRDILSIEDAEDTGDSYTYGHSPSGKLIYSKNFTPVIKSVCNDAFESSYLLSYEMLLPAYFNHKKDRRSEETALNKVDILLTLKKDSKWLDIKFTVNNASKDHRLRTLIKTGFTTDTTSATTPYDVIARDRKEILKGVKNGTQPNSGCISIDGDNEGIAVLNKGLYEYEHLMDDNGILAITLLRGNANISNGEAQTWKVPGNQCLRELELELGIYPYAGDCNEARAVQMAKSFQNDLMCYFQPYDTKKFVGGRPAVQDSQIKEIFYRPDPYANIVLPMEKSFVSIKGDGVVLSALKRAEKDDALIVRVYNTLATETTFELKFHENLTNVYKVNLNEDTKGSLPFEGKYLRNFKLKPKEIVTLAIETTKK